MRSQRKRRLHLEKTTLRVLTEAELDQAHGAMRTAMCTTQTKTWDGCIAPLPVDPMPIGEPDPGVSPPSEITVSE